jgi:hypothetical protein
MMHHKIIIYSHSRLGAHPFLHCRCALLEEVQEVNPDVLRRVRQHVAGFAYPGHARSTYMFVSTVAIWLSLFMLGRWRFQHLPLNKPWGLAVAACWLVVENGLVCESICLAAGARVVAVLARVLQC